MSGEAERSLLEERPGHPPLGWLVPCGHREPSEVTGPGRLQRALPQEVCSGNAVSTSDWERDQSGPLHPVLPLLGNPPHLLLSLPISWPFEWKQSSLPLVLPTFYIQMIGSAEGFTSRFGFFSTLMKELK